jgi:hypothetical protein
VKGNSWLLRLGIGLAIGGSVYACRANDASMDTAGDGIGIGGKGGAPGVCAPGRQGCPCDTNGADAQCGATVGRYSGYLTCAVGTSVCQGGQWGPCIGTTVVTKSVAGATIGSGGLRALSTTTLCQPGSTSPQCADPCDPNVFTLTTSGACTGLACQLATDCPGNGVTSLSGTVFDPAGVNPLYDAYVYVPIDASGQLPGFSPGASCDPCGGAGIDAVAVTKTGPDGTFTLANVPSTDVAPGRPIPLVVQLGKWRREMMLPSVPKCQTTAVDPSSSRLPRNMFDGYGGQADLPKMAVAIASDPLECLLLRMGVDQAEFQVPGTGTRRIDYYDTKNGDQFQTPASLVGSVGTLMTYDLVLLPCEGREDDGNDPFADNVSAYANAGGRVFTTHYGYTWLATPTTGVAMRTNPATGSVNPFYGVANWNLDVQGYPVATTAAIDMTGAGGQAFPKGQAFASWLQKVGASSTFGQLSLTQARHDVSSVGVGPTQWMHDLSMPGEPYYFSFETPLGAVGADGGAATCGRVGYADFHVPTTALVDPDSGGECASDADCGFTAKCNPGALGTCTPVECASTEDCGIEGYSCARGSPGTCVAQACMSDRDCNSRLCLSNGTCGCTQDSQCVGGPCRGQVCAGPPQSCSEDFQCGSVGQCAGATDSACQKSCTSDSDCTHGELCVTGQCTGCRDESNCRSGSCIGATASMCSASSATFPLSCKQGRLSPEEDALEFLLLDRTACVAPIVATPSGPSTALPPYDVVTFSEDISSSCPMGTRAVWRELDWQATIPDSASIVFSAQTVESPTDGGLTDYSTVQVVALLTATKSTVLPGVDAVLIDTGTTGAFNLAMPPVISRSNLRLTVTMNPTTDKLGAPTLIEWQVKADCLPSE